MKSVMSNFVKFFFVVGNTAAGSTQSEGRTNDSRESDSVFYKIKGVFISCNNLRRNTRLTDAFHCILKHLAVFCLINSFRFCTEQANIVTFKEARFSQLHTKCQTSLSAKRRKNAVRFFLFDDSLNSFNSKRLNINMVCHTVVSHQGSRIRVYKNNLKSLLLQSLTSLASRIIKFRSLTNNNRTRTDNHYFMKIFV